MEKRGDFFPLPKRMIFIALALRAVAVLFASNFPREDRIPCKLQCGAKVHKNDTGKQFVH